MKTYAIIATEKGDMKAELYADETPGTVANFVDLAEHGGEVGLARQVEGSGHGLDALRASSHLGRGLLTADVEYGAILS